MSIKAMRSGVRVGALKDFPTFEKQFRHTVALHQQMFDFEYDTDAEVERYREYVTCV